MISNMRTVFRAARDGVYLDSIPGVYLTDIRETPKLERTAAVNPAMSGQMLLWSDRTSLEVTLTCMVKPHADGMVGLDRPSILRAAIAAVTEWAQSGSYLEVSYREGQRLYCVPTTIPDIASVRQWHKEFRIVFTAFALPYWSREQTHTVTVSGTTTYTYTEAGNAGLYAPADVSLAMTSAAESIQLKAESSSRVSEMLFNFPTNAELAADDVFILTHDHAWWFFAAGYRRGSVVTNCLALRDASSSDDLLTTSGASNTFTFTPGTATYTATLTTRGLFL